MSEPTDRPFAEIVAKVAQHAEEGHLCYQKFTCAGCGQRLMMDQPNAVFRTGTCDKCDVVTNIEERGCGYMLELRIRTPVSKR